MNTDFRGLETDWEEIGREGIIHYPYLDDARVPHYGGTP